MPTNSSYEALAVHFSRIVSRSHGTDGQAKEVRLIAPVTVTCSQVRHAAAGRDLDVVGSVETARLASGTRDECSVALQGAIVGADADPAAQPVAANDAISWRPLDIISWQPRTADAVWRCTLIAVSDGAEADMAVLRWVDPTRVCRTWFGRDSLGAVSWNVR